MKDEAECICHSPAEGASQQSAAEAGAPEQSAAEAGAPGLPAVDDASEQRGTEPCVTEPGECAAAEPGGKRTCECRYKETERSREFQTELTRRLNRAIGQLNGVKGMIDDNRYCGDVLTQLAAAERAVHTVSEMLLQDHLETCVIERVRRGDDAVIDEAMLLIKRFAR